MQERAVWRPVFRRFGIPVLVGLCDSGGGMVMALGGAMAKPRDDRQKDLLKPALEAIIDLGHPLVRLAGEIDWGFLDGRFASVCAAGDAAGGGAVHPEAHARPVGRGVVRALG